jgi:hypothetical protein
MNILKLLSSDSFLTVNKELARVFDSIETAAIFAHLAGMQQYWDQVNGTDGEWFYSTREDIKWETMVNDKQQVKSIEVLKSFGILETKYAGMPKRVYYRIGEIQINNLISLMRQNGASRCSKMEHQDTPKWSITNKNIYKNKIIEEQAPKKDENNELLEEKIDPHDTLSERYTPRLSFFDMSDANDKLKLFLSHEKNIDFCREQAMSRKTSEEVRAYIKTFVTKFYGSQYEKRMKTFPELIRKFCEWMKRERPEVVPVTEETLESKKESFIKAMTEAGKVKVLDKFIARDLTKFVEQTKEFISKTKFLKKMEQPNLNEWVLLAYEFDLRAEKRQYLYQVLEQIEIDPYKQNYKGIYKAITATAK